MNKFFTSIFFILLLMTGPGKAFGENPLNYPGKIDIKFPDFFAENSKSLFAPIDVLSKASYIRKLQFDINKGTESQEFTGTKFILHLGSIPKVLLNSQPDTVIQWGHNLRDLFLLLSIGVNMQDFNYLDIQRRRENNYIYHFNFLIDFWFK
jgi:hypothetical protein